MVLILESCRPGRMWKHRKAAEKGLAPSQKFRKSSVDWRRQIERGTLKMDPKATPQKYHGVQIHRDIDADPESAIGLCGL